MSFSILHEVYFGFITTQTLHSDGKSLWKLLFLFISLYFTLLIDWLARHPFSRSECTLIELDRALFARETFVDGDGATLPCYHRCSTRQIHQAAFTFGWGVGEMSLTEMLEVSADTISIGNEPLAQRVCDAWR